MVRGTETGMNSTNAAIDHATTLEEASATGWKILNADKAAVSVEVRIKLDGGRLMSVWVARDGIYSKNPHAS